MRPAADAVNFELDDDDISLAMQIADRLRREFIVIGEAVVKTADETGVPYHIVASALCSEALTFAACVHSGTPESFREMAAAASVMITGTKEKAEPVKPSNRKPPH